MHDADSIIGPFFEQCPPRTVPFLSSLKFSGNRLLTEGYLSKVTHPGSDLLLDFVDFPKGSDFSDKPR